MKKLTALFMALILMITCLPTTVLAQKSNEPVVSGEVRKIEGETIVEEDGKAYVAFDIGNIKLKESKMKKHGKRDLTSQTIYRQNTPASNPYDRFKLKVIYLGRGLNEFKLPTQDVEIEENGVRRTIKAFEVKLSTSEPSTSTVKEVVLGHRYVQESEVGFTQAGVVAYPFTMDTSVQDLDTKLNGSLRILVPYTYLYHPELNIEDSREGSTFVLYLKQKVNPLWKSEWHIKDEQNKPDIFAYYKHTQVKESAYFKLPLEDDKVYTMESGTGVTDLYWDGTGVVNAYPENKEKAKQGGHFYPIIIGDDAVVDEFDNRDYSGKISYDNLKFTSNATTPNITTGFGIPRKPNTDGFIKVDNVKYLLNLYPTDKQQTDINAKVKNYVTGEEELAYRQIKRYAVYEALEVKFNTGKGFLSEADKTANKSNQEIGTAQEIGYSEKIAGNESGRKINVPTDTLVPPEAATGEPANEFKGWALTADATTPLFKNQDEANAYVKPFTETTTFHAIYGPKAQGKVKVEYVDASNQPIDAKYQLKGQEYPAEKPGNIDETVGTEVASTAKAPKFLGYEVTSVEVKPATGQTTATYTDPATATVTYKYKKLADIIPEDVKDTYKKVTIKVDSNKGQFKKGATVKTESAFVYYVNPVEGKSLQDVLTASDLTAESKDTNVYKIDTAKPWKFDPTQTEGTPTVPAADFALTTVVGKDNVKDTGVTMEVNFKETDAEKYGAQLTPQDIVKWVGDRVTADDWKTGVKPITGVTFKSVEDQSNRNTNAAGVFLGELKVTFNDDSTAEVDKQKLIVREKKADKKEPKGEDPGTYPDDAIEVKFVAGTGIEKLDPANKVMVLQKDETLVEGDYPAVTVDSNYKAKVTKLEYYDVQPGKITNPEPQQGKIKYVKTITASTTIKGEGSAEVVYKAGTEDLTSKLAGLKIAGQKYPANNRVTGTEDTAIDTSKITQPELLGYEKDGAITTEPATNATYTEAGTAKVIFHYKKIDDIVGPVNPGNTKPAGYVEVIFKSGIYGKFNPDADVKYYVNPKTATINTTAQTLFGKDKTGTDINKNFPTAEVRDNYKAVWTNDLDNNGKQKWELNPTDALSGTKIKDNFDSNKTITFTALYKEKDKKDVTFNFEFYKGSIDPSNKLANNKKGDFNPTVSNLSNRHVGSDITLETFDTLNKKVTTGDLRGTWTFDGWYRSGAKVTVTPKVSETDAENVFTGKWIITEDTKYKVAYKYEYTNDTGIINPSKDGIEQAPTDSNEYYENVNVPANANKPSTKVVQVKESGKVIGEWVFQGWKPNPLTISSTKANEFIGTWEFTEKLVRPVDPNHPDKQADEVEVKFLKGEHGKLSGIALVGGNEVEVTGRDELAYYVKEKATWAAMKGYIPTALADYGWRVANPSWKPVLPEVTVKVVAGKKEFTAQYVAKPTDRYITLTLDENYRNGKITDYEVLEGDLIEDYLYIPRRRGYIFKGWSYNSRRLEEVRPGDRIYYPTTLYAIWTKQKAKDDEEVEPIDTRPVNEHKAYMFGYTDGTVRPNGSITRAEAAALVTRLLGIESYASSEQPVFTDTPSSWYNKAINAAVARGIMKGYPDGRFRPNAPITRAEFTQMIYTFDNKPYGEAPFVDVKGHWAERAIGSEYQAKRIAGYPDGLFRPDANITRAEAVVILNKIFERNYDAMSAINAMNKEKIKVFTDLYRSFWGYNEMIEACNTHSFKRRRAGFVEEDWTLVK